jgi:alanine racemase
MVRCGIALYGITPAPGVGADLGLKPAMRVSSEVSHIAVVRAGDALSYGLRHTFDDDMLVATVPVGYADGMTRGLWETGGEVLIRGRRRPVRGVITMDQFMVELGPPDSPEAMAVERGDEVVLLGSQPEPGDGAHGEVDAWEWAQRLRTIAYEVVCGFSPRMPRTYTNG